MAVNKEPSHNPLPSPLSGIPGFTVCPSSTKPNLPGGRALWLAPYSGQSAGDTGLGQDGNRQERLSPIPLPRIKIAVPTFVPWIAPLLFGRRVLGEISPGTAERFVAGLSLHHFPVPSLPGKQI